jgi:hypothetical protein
MLRTSQSVRISELAQLQYAGIPGISRSCYRALERIAQCGEKIEEARLISCSGAHAFLLKLDELEWVVIQSGFSSGYPGEGPRTLALALHFLETIRAPIEEVEVSRELFERLEAAALTQKDLDLLRDASPVRPWRWPDYIYEWRHLVPMSANDAAALRKMPLAMTWPLIDLRLSDLAFEFLDRPEESLLKGFRRLEEVLRSRTGLKEHGAKLFQRAFAGDSSRLAWPEIDAGEQTGRAQLFTGAFMAFRNPLAHREQPLDPRALLHQFVQLNQLFLLEAEASVRPEEELQEKNS